MHVLCRPAPRDTVNERMSFEVEGHDGLCEKCLPDVHLSEHLGLSSWCCLKILRSAKELRLAGGSPSPGADLNDL